MGKAMTHTQSHQFEDRSEKNPTQPTQADRKPFEAPQVRWEERLTKMTAEQGFFGAES